MIKIEDFIAPLVTDFYKTGHVDMTPAGTTRIYSNITPRSSRLLKALPDFDEKALIIGLQRAIDDLHTLWVEGFFKLAKNYVLNRIRRRLVRSLPSNVNIDGLIEHFADLHDLGHLPIRIKTLPEGRRVRMKVPFLTIVNTHDCFAFITNYLETIMSNETWKTIVNATTAFEYRRYLSAKAIETTGNDAGVLFQGHDFSARGMSGFVDSSNSGIAHLSCFVGTDTISAIEVVEHHYDVADDELVGCSVPATEHMIMCLGGQDGEINTFRRLIQDSFPTGIISIVSDTWDFFQVVTSYVTELKDTILSRGVDSNGMAKVVFRPDCYSDDTSILTPSGWKFFKDLDENDLVAEVRNDGSYRFVKPSKIIHQRYVGDMHSFKDHYGKIDLLVTPNHRMILNQLNRFNEWEERIVEAQNLTKFGNYKQKMIRSAKAQNSHKQLSNLERLKIAFQADGSYCTNMKTSIRFSFSKQRKIDRLISILDRLDLEYKIYPLADRRFEFNIKIDADIMSKSFDWVDISNLSYEWCQGFIEELSHWDSSIRSAKRFKFDTTNKNVADIVEIIAISANKGVFRKTNVDNRSDKFSDIHTLSIMKDNTIGGQSWTHKTEHYDGMVHCVTVPSGKLLVKRNNSILVCGNSGDPVKIICGDPDAPVGSPEYKGAVECLWEVFGGTVSEQGYKVINERVGVIYGDSITLERMVAIVEGLMAKGFASTNVIFGIGSYTYQFVTRDSLSIATKATEGVVNGVSLDLLKNPKTDGGTKKSASGLLRVEDIDGDFVLFEHQTVEQESLGALTVRYENGQFFNRQKWSVIRGNVEDELLKIKD